MMHYEEIQTGDELQLNIEGKIDTLSCDQFQTLVLKSFTKCNRLIINMEKVAYMSSSGLRALVLGNRTAESKGGRLTIINSPEQVMEVFRVTGMLDVLDIR